uniref:Spermine synthase n=1 Tax=Panagrolaimus sp. JU765 TaxID=591449 RepID=A0AC34QV62_9BILA
MRLSCFVKKSKEKLMFLTAVLVVLFFWFHSSTVGDNYVEPAISFRRRPIDDFWRQLSKEEVVRDIMCSVEDPEAPCFAVVDVKDTYQKYRIMQSDDLPNGVHSRMRLKKSKENSEMVDKQFLMSAYLRGLLLSVYLAKPVVESSKVLVIGGGGFVLPNFLASLEKPPLVEVVELNGICIALSKFWFDLQPGPKLKVFKDDGIEFLKRKQQSEYDLIVLDAASDQGEVLASPLPFFLTSEGVKTVKNTLKSDGTVSVNIIAKNFSRNIPDALEKIRTLYLTEFANCFGISSQDLANFLLTCTNNPSFEVLTSKNLKSKVKSLPSTISRFYDRSFYLF